METAVTIPVPGKTFNEHLALGSDGFWYMKDGNGNWIKVNIQPIVEV